MAETTHIRQETMFSPSALLHIFNNTLSNEATRRSFLIRGRYSPGKNVAYSGYYYDQLKDENAGSSLTLVVPALMRHSLQPDQTIECHAYLTRKVNLAGGRIDLQVNLIDLLSQQKTALSEETIRSLELLQQKAQSGYRDVDSFIKQCIIQQRKVRVTILTGKTGIIDSDIKHQLKEAIGLYEFRFVGVSLTSENELITAMQQYASQTDVLCISRGGGENIEFFNKPAIAEAALLMDVLLITAIGHKEDNTLLQKIADKAFITPTALGQYFNDIYNQTADELQHSKAVLAEQISTQLKANYDKQIQNLNDTLNANQRLYEKYKEENQSIHAKELALLATQHEALSQRHRQEMQQLQQLADERRKMFEQLQHAQSKPLYYKLGWAIAILLVIVIVLLFRSSH